MSAHVKPPIVTVYNLTNYKDTPTGKPTRSFCFLGDVPAGVRNAVTRAHRTDADKQIINNYYGKSIKPSYDDLNDIETSDYSGGGGSEDTNVIRIFGQIYDKSCIINIAKDEPRMSIHGDAMHITPEHDFCVAVRACREYVILGNEHRDKPGVVLTKEQIEPARIIPDSYFIIDNDTVNTNATTSQPTGGNELDDIEQLLNEKPRVAVENLSTIAFEPGIEYVTDIHMYAEDRFGEIMEKIYLATGIPTYRQHIFFVQDKQIHTTYTIYADTIVGINITNHAGINVYGLPIDKILYENRHTISVHAQDMFMTLGSTGAYHMYVVDLAAALASARSQFDEMLRDEYQFDLVYYGFILKYWPRLTRACFRDYITNEADLYSSYPELAKPRVTLAQQYAAERTIIDAQNKIMTRALGASNISHAITAMTAMVNKAQISLNIRNLFDNLAASESFPEMRAYVEHEGRRYVLIKRYNYVRVPVTFPVNMTTGLVIALRTNTTVINDTSIFLNVLPNGRYYIRANWPEEDQMDFPDAISVLSRACNAAVEMINNTSNVFTMGRSLPLLSKHNIEYTGLNVSIFWRKVILESAFKALKNAFESYIAARILTPRTSAYDRAEYVFRKGMYEFDNSVLDRILGTFNQYLYLSDQTVRQKWMQQYDGRIMRMIHRTTDVKFEIVNIRETEFRTIYSYLAAFVFSANISTATTTHTVKKLRKLREQDPELFNIKKYGTAKVYSRICQKKQQPVVYTAEEIEQMPARDVARLVKYWNFTLNKPAYYMCPNRKYPHLSFITGVHPKHYCLPCCNKKSATDSKKQRIVNTCLAAHMFDETALSTHRHVIRYGKVLEPMRLSKVPDGNMSTLLVGTTTAPYGWYIYGVHNGNAGVLHAVAAALDIKPGDLIERMIKLLTSDNATQLFNSLLHGEIINYFASVDELIVALRGYDAAIIPGRFTAWAALITELMFVDDVSVYEFVDIHANGNVELVASRAAPRSKCIVVFNVAGRYYPMFLLDIDEYFKTMHVYARAFTPKHKLIVTIWRMVAWDSTNAHTIDYAYVVSRGLAVNRKYINRHNLCYGILIDGVYVSLDPSTYTTDGVPVEFSAVSTSDITGTRERLVEILATIGMDVVNIDDNAGTIIAVGGYACYYNDVNITNTILELNSIILNNVASVDISAKYNHALHTKFAYEVFVNEFVKTINSGINTATRARVREIVTSKNITALRTIVNANDFAILRDQIINIRDRKTLLEAIDEYRYEFDRVDITASTHEEMIAILRPICDQFAVEGKPNGNFPNIYSSCKDKTKTKSTGYCSNGKLITENLPLKIDLLASDLLNPLKCKYILTGLFMDIIINYFDFIKRPSETITIERIIESVLGS